jgi:hypothetical protein
VAGGYSAARAGPVNTIKRTNRTNRMTAFIAFERSGKLR